MKQKGTKNWLKKYISTSKKVINNPKSFFENLHSDSDLKKHLLYLTYLWAAAHVLAFGGRLLFDYLYPYVLSLVNKTSFEPQVDLGSFVVGYLVSVPLGIGFGLLWTMFVGLILHLWVKLFRGKGGIFDTIRILIYAFTPMLLFGWVPLISWFLPLYMAYMLIWGIHFTHKIPVKRATIAIGLPVLLLLILEAVSFYLLFTQAK